MSLKKVGKVWAFRINGEKDKRTGKRKQIYRSGFKTKREAEKVMNELRAQIDSGSFFEPSKIPFDEFINDWLQGTYIYEVQLSSFEVAEIAVRVHLIPYFKQTPLDQVTAFDIDRFYAEKLKAGLANATIRKIHNILSKSLQKAVQWELIKANPAKNATPPTVHKKRIRIWSVEEAKAFLEVSQKNNEAIPFLLALFTGMRKGEILALRWKNVDLSKGVIYVEESLSRSRAKGLYVKEVKTSHSNREVYLSPSLNEALAQYKKHQVNNAYDLVVTSKNGHFLDPRNLLRKYKRLIEEADVPYIPFHNLRHTHATILMRMGENPKVVSERLGHARVGITLDIYSHTNQEMQRRSADRFDNNFWS